MTIIALKPKAAALDHKIPPVAIPFASMKPCKRPWFIDTAAIDRVAGPGLARERKAAIRMIE